MTDAQIANLALSLIGGNPITALTDTTRQGIVCNKWFATARDEALSSFPWNFARKRATLSLPWVSLTGSAITNSAGLINVTKASHGLTTGLRVMLDEVEGVTAANGSWLITSVDTNNFTLDDSVFSGAYTSGTGRYVEQPLFGWAYKYTLPTDCLRVLRVNGDDATEDDGDPHEVEGALLLTDADEVALRYVFQETATANWPAEFRNAFSLLLGSYLATDLIGTGTGRASQLRQQFDLAIAPKAKATNSRQNKNRNRVQGYDSKVLAARRGTLGY